MRLTKKHAVLLTLALTGVIAFGGFFAFFVRMYQRDLQMLNSFIVSYQEYDQAVSTYSSMVLSPGASGAPTADKLRAKTQDALADLNAAASARISSLIKNEKEVMAAMQATATAAGQELAALQAFRAAAADGQGRLDDLQKGISAVTAQRQAGYAHFQDFAEIHQN
jgi:hypothetical protein